jgi:hypothetical protein
MVWENNFLSTAWSYVLTSSDEISAGKQQRPRQNQTHLQRQLKRQSAAKTGVSIQTKAAALVRKNIVPRTIRSSARLRSKFKTAE